MPEARTTPERIRIKRYASGKYYLYADAAPEHAAIVEQAVIEAARVCIRFDDNRFRERLRAARIPDAVINRYLDSIDVIDDVFGVGKNPG